MTPYDQGDILLLNAFPYSNLGDTKKRPALVLADLGDQDIVVARVTSAPLRNIYDFEIKRWKECGLLLPSTIRLSKVATLSKTLILKKLGKLDSPDRRQIRSRLKKLLKL